jgi:hypothetical protein
MKEWFLGKIVTAITFCPFQRQKKTKKTEKNCINVVYNERLWNFLLKTDFSSKQMIV